MFELLLNFILVINASLGQLPQVSNHACSRPCEHGRNLLCEYEFHVEWYQTLSSACFNCPAPTTDCFRQDCIPADGFKRMVQVVNRMLPGPKIEVCEGDDVSVTVFNDMHAESTTIHWHGQHQMETQYMDGVPFVTQCPINPGTVFKYRFRAAGGTHFWHSHTGVQRGNGLFGALVVRLPNSENRNLYDHDLSEHIILISDFNEREANHVFVRRYFDRVDDMPRSLLVNGLGRYTNLANATNEIPPARFTVQYGMRYRFRIIAATFMDIPVRFTIDNHKFTVIATDGNDIEPVETDSLTITPGERFDIVVNANQGVRMNWMRFQGLIMGEIASTHQAAILQYGEAFGSAYPEGVPSYPTASRPGLQINGLNMPSSNVPIDELRHAGPQANVSGDALQLYITYDIRAIIDPRFQLSQPSRSNDILNRTDLPTLNNIALKLFSYPLLSQRNQIPADAFCNGANVHTQCKTEFCACPHVIKLELNQLVELVLIDEGILFNVSHPIHLHGHSFSVIGSERLGTSTTEQTVWDRDQRGLLKRNYVKPPIKDTVAVPDGGYTIVRFFAKNPGFWLLHCHVDFHSELGMGLVFQVGEFSQMPAVPANFPTCGDYTTAPTPPTMDDLYVNYIDDIY